MFVLSSPRFLAVFDEQVQNGCLFHLECSGMPISRYESISGLIGFLALKVARSFAFSQDTAD